MFKKFFKFLKGYVIIELSEKNAERFINICLRRNIEIHDTKPLDNGKIQISVLRRDFRLLRSVSHKTGTRVRIKQKRGLYDIIRRYGKRYAFAIGFFAFLLFIAITSQFIWTVEINGVENADYEKIITILEENGVKAGAPKKKLPPLDEIKKSIINHTDDIAWAWVYIEGTKARVEVYEQILPPHVIDKNAPCDIVSRCDGVIKKLTAKNGETKLKKGDAVLAGDVIISGKVATYREGEPEDYIYVHSVGDIEAYTYHKAEGDYPLYREYRDKTGDKKAFYTLEVFGKQFNLFRNKSISYEDFDKIEKRHELTLPFFGYTGIAWHSEKYEEVIVNREQISEEFALETAKNELEEKISKDLMPNSVLIKSELSYNKTDNETIHVTLNMDFTENIGVEMPAEEE